MSAAAPTPGRPRLGTLLIREGKLSEEGLKEALEAQVIHGGRLGTNLLELGLLDEQTLAAALNHSAFNTANALGPWLGGMAIAAGYGWTSTGWVGAALALGGLAIWIVAVLDSRR